MNRAGMKLNCHLEGDSALDFERLAMTLKIGNFAPGKPKQQATLVGAMLLVMDAALTEFAEKTGRRYPELAELLESAGVKRTEVARLLGEEAVTE
ncbi:hypothetical protein [Paraburkholderia sediminicola]|uniref:hypothetical protein n=1 Tax=Paraburkholderia sediminicola TaxID=458836 RepID=UPI0038B80BFA